MKRLPLALVCTAMGCGPTLREPTTFTPDKVREALFADRCRLQRYYDTNPPPLRLLVDQNVSADPRVAWGRATYALQSKPQRAELDALLRRTYRRLELAPHPMSKEVQLDVRYQIRRGRRQLPIGARTVIRGLSNDPIELPYHPCIGAFVFGRHHYDLRRRLVEARR
ncbi:MAG: hypothetical protein CSA65_02660 [Proteobacteria bacterium]|nr:MAG: hypothetical protein CSA65_02660 [Pseudomonadota bacterium]